MRAMGLEPETQYIVGNEFNSINPVTGQPEFSIFSGLFKGLKRAVKGVVKVFKTLAPIVLSVGLSMTPLGIIAGTALGSGIGTLIQGGSFKDAMKMAAIGGATAGLFKGLQGSWQGMKPGGAGIVGGFQEGVASGMPGAAAQQAILQKAAADQAALMPAEAGPGSVQQSLDLLRGPQPVAGKVTAQHLGTGFDPGTLRPGGAPGVPTSAAANKVISSPFSTDLVMTQGGINTSALGLGAPAGAGAPGASPLGGWNIGDPIPKMPTVGGMPPPAPRSAGFNINQQKPPSYAWDPLKDMPTGEWQLGSGGGGGGATGTPAVGPDRGFTTEFTDIFKSGGRDPFSAAKQAFFPSDINPTEYLKNKLQLPATATVSDIVRVGGLPYEQQLLRAAAEIEASGLNPGMFRKYLPLAGAGYGLLGATGGFEQPEEEPPEDPFGMGGKTAMELVQENPAKYRVFSQGAPYSVPYSVPGGAQGGDVTKCIPHRNTGGNFPPRDGAISGPGTGTSDDIRAMLSDGEFVMTARAVEGAGNGDRRRGVRKMYEVMRGFEGVA